MPCITIGSPEPRYLAAADLLIGDMSDTNYEFLLFDRPVILLANQWLRDNFGDIGEMVTLPELEPALWAHLREPGLFANQRKSWLEKTIHQPHGNASRRVLQTARERSGFDRPLIIVVHGGDPVRLTNLRPIYHQARQMGLPAKLVVRPSLSRWAAQPIFFGAHFEDLNYNRGYRVHLDHGLKGQGTANVEMSRQDYQRHEYFPKIDLHLTAGRVGQARTEMLLGPLRERAVIVGYPKADDLNRCNTPQNRAQVCQELGLDPGLPLVVYAPAGKLSQEKPGGSLCPKVLAELESIGGGHVCNIMIKLKSPSKRFAGRAFNKLRRTLNL